MSFYSSLGISQLFLRPDLFARAARLPRVGPAQAQHLDRFANSRFVQDPSGDRQLAPLIDRIRERGNEDDLRYLASRLARILQGKPDFYQSVLDEIGLSLTAPPFSSEVLSFWLGPIRDHAGVPYVEVVRERLAIGVNLLLEFADAKTLFAIFQGEEEFLGLLRRPVATEQGILRIGRERADEPVFILGEQFPRHPDFETLDLEWLVEAEAVPSLARFYEASKGSRQILSGRRILRLGDSFAIGNGFSLSFGLPQFERTVASVDLGSVAARVEEGAEEAAQEKIWSRVIAEEIEYWSKQPHSALAERELEAALRAAEGFDGFEERFPGRLQEGRERLSLWRSKTESGPTSVLPSIAFALTPLASPIAVTARGFQLIPSEGGTVHFFELPREGDSIHIGRERVDSPHLILPDRRVSGSHAQISRGPKGEIIITDLGSRNGTYVGARRLPRLGSETITTSGVRVRFGLLPPFELRFFSEIEEGGTKLEVVPPPQANIPTHVLSAAQRNPIPPSHVLGVSEEEILLSPWRLWLRRLRFWR